MTQTFTQKIYNEKVVFWFLVSILGLCTLVYILSIHATVRNIVTRENVEERISNLSLDIASKEFQYISQKNTITKVLATTLGFSEVQSRTYISPEQTKQVSYLSR